jgi:hypothetical protein
LSWVLVDAPAEYLRETVNVYLAGQAAWRDELPLVVMLQPFMYFPPQETHWLSRPPRRETPLLYRALRIACRLTPRVPIEDVELGAGSGVGQFMEMGGWPDNPWMRWMTSFDLATFHLHAVTPTRARYSLAPTNFYLASLKARSLLDGLALHLLEVYAPHLLQQPGGGGVLAGSAAAAGGLGEVSPSVPTRDQEADRPSRPPRREPKPPTAPTNPRVWLRWQATWLQVQADAARGKHHTEIAEWLKRHYPELKCSPDTLTAIIRAGRAGLLRGDLQLSDSPG